MKACGVVTEKNKYSTIWKKAYFRYLLICGNCKANNVINRGVELESKTSLKFGVNKSQIYETSIDSMTESILLA